MQTYSVHIRELAGRWAPEDSSQRYHSRWPTPARVHIWQHSNAAAPLPAAPLVTSSVSPYTTNAAACFYTLQHHQICQTTNEQSRCLATGIGNLCVMLGKIIALRLSLSTVRRVPCEILNSSLRRTCMQQSYSKASLSRGTQPVS